MGGQRAAAPQEVNVEIIKLDPALDRIVPANPKISKLAEGFKFTEGPLWMRDGALLFSDPNHNTIYKYTAAGSLLFFRTEAAMPAPISYGQPGSNGLTLDRE